MLAINCLFLSRAHDRNKGKTQKVSKGLSVRKFTQTCTCRNSSNAAFKLHIYICTKKVPLLVLVNIPVPASSCQRRTF